MKKRWQLLFFVSSLLAVFYLGSYVVLSRRAYAEADRYDSDGFYYVSPENSDHWRIKNYGCVYLYYPLNLVDQWLGLGRPPACEPMWGLSANRNWYHGL